MFLWVAVTSKKTVLRIAEDGLCHSPDIRGQAAMSRSFSRTPLALPSSAVLGRPSRPEHRTRLHRKTATFYEMVYCVECFFSGGVAGGEEGLDCIQQRRDVFLGQRERLVLVMFIRNDLQPIRIGPVEQLSLNTPWACVVRLTSPCRGSDRKAVALDLWSTRCIAGGPNDF